MFQTPACEFGRPLHPANDQCDGQSVAGGECCRGMLREQIELPFQENRTESTQRDNPCSFSNGVRRSVANSDQVFPKEAGLQSIWRDK
jgi:hypothetical protein